MEGEGEEMKIEEIEHYLAKLNYEDGEVAWEASIWFDGCYIECIESLLQEVKRLRGGRMSATESKTPE